MVHTAEREPIYLALPFKGEVASERVNRRYFSAFRRTFSSATLKKLVHYIGTIFSESESQGTFAWLIYGGLFILMLLRGRIYRSYDQAHISKNQRTSSNLASHSWEQSHPQFRGCTLSWHKIKLWSPLEPSVWFTKHSWTNRSLLGNAYWQPLNRLPFDNASLFFVCKNSLQDTYVMQRYLFSNISSGIYNCNEYQME